MKFEEPSGICKYLNYYTPGILVTHPVDEKTRLKYNLKPLGIDRFSYLVRYVPPSQYSGKVVRIDDFHRDNSDRISMKKLATLIKEQNLKGKLIDDVLILYKLYYS